MVTSFIVSAIVFGCPLELGVGFESSCGDSQFGICSRCIYLLVSLSDLGARLRVLLT